MTGKYSGLAPAITAFTATFSTVYSQAARNWRSAACGRPSRPGLRLVVRQHRGDALLGRQHDRQLVGPVVLEELALQIVLGIGSTRRGVVRSNVVAPADIGLAVQRAWSDLR